MIDWLKEFSWFGNSLFAWIVAAIAAVIGFIVLITIAKVAAKRCRNLADRHAGNRPLHLLARMTAATRGWILLLLAIAVAAQGLHFAAGIEGGIHWSIVALIGIQVALWLLAAIGGWLETAAPGGNMRDNNPVIYSLLMFAVRLLVWVVLLMILLSQAGIQIGALIASLGVGGIAIALAARNVLEDLFASICIGLDKPFTVGDFIGFADKLGVVGKVGIKTTRIQSLSGEELILNNSTLLAQQIHNYSRMAERRIAFSFRVPLETHVDKVRAIPAAVNAIIEAEDRTRLDRGHFAGIDKEGFRFDFVYYMLTPDFSRYRDAQQSINLQIMDKLEELQVPFAGVVRIIGDNATALTID